MAKNNNEFEQEVARMKKLIGELNTVMSENNNPLSEEDKLELQEKLEALENLGGYLKSDSDVFNAMIMVKTANKAIEYMLKDLRYVGPEKMFALEEDEELQGILDFFGVERDEMPMPSMPRQRGRDYEILIDEDGNERVYDILREENRREYERKTPNTIDSIIEIPKSKNNYAHYDPKEEKIVIDPEKAPKRDPMEEVIRKIIEQNESDSKSENEGDDENEL